MKPLKLTVYPRVEHYGHEAGEWFYACPACGFPENDAPQPQYKRLTDAELAAESYRAAAWIGAKGRAYATDEGRNIAFAAAFTFGPETRDEHEWLVMHRFANHPHYDEDVLS